MAGPDRIILCGGAVPPAQADEDQIVRLDLGGDNPNVTLEMGDLSRRLSADIPDVLTDLLEIATYIYCADQAVPRGGEGTLNFGKDWRRQFTFHIPVRCPAIWSSPEIADSLRNTLSFLSDDEKYEFYFTQQTGAPPIQRYLTLGVTDPGTQDFEEVVPFSGGLDSLGGAVREAVICKRRVALIGHRSNAKTSSHQNRLATSMGPFCPTNPPFFVPVWVHKDKALTREATQRSRSFLYASLALVVAWVFGLKRIRFYENGVVGLNLPISEQAVGARATRTTHPQVLNGFAKIFSLLIGGSFTVENPFLWLTKTEVVNLIGEAGCGDLIQHSVSCMHTYQQSTEHPHCGRCSQCISRRFATLASRYGHCDPANRYRIDLLEDERLRDVDLTLMESFIRMATEIRSMTNFQMIEHYGEIGRVLRHVPPLTADQVADRIIRLYKKHAEEVTGVIDDGIRIHASDIREANLPATCALILAVPGSYKTVAVVQKPPAPALEGDTQHGPVAGAVQYPENLFHREKDVWTLTFDGKTVHVGDLVGIGYIAELLSHPRTEIEAAALGVPIGESADVTAEISLVDDEKTTRAGAARCRSRSRATASMPGLPMADAKAIRTVKAALVEWQAKLAGTPENDHPRRSQLQDEISKLQNYLAQVEGHRGQPRMVGGIAQRSRSRVKHVISRAIHRIAAQHPSLGNHLQDSIRTGTTNIYLPPELPDWHF